jgi:hypothetical protein
MLIPCRLRTRFFARVQKHVQNAFLCEKSVQKHSWRFFAFSDLWQNGSRNEGVFQKHAERKMKNLEQKETKRTKSKCDCVEISSRPLVADEVTRRSWPLRSVGRTSEQLARSSGIRRLASAATGRLAASWLCAENASEVAQSICNSLISTIVLDISRLVGGHERLLPHFGYAPFALFHGYSLGLAYSPC